MLVHGIWNTSKVFRRLTKNLEAAGFEVHAWDSSPNDGSAPLLALAEQLAERVEATLGGERSFSLVGFSMGGLVSRCYLQRLGGVRRVRKFVSISSPHQGTFWGRFGKKAGIAEMSPTSELLLALNSKMEELAQVPCLSLYTPWDLMILPARSSHFGVGETRTFTVPLHQWMPDDERVGRATVEFLSR